MIAQFSSFFFFLFSFFFFFLPRLHSNRVETCVKASRRHTCHYLHVFLSLSLHLLSSDSLLSRFDACPSAEHQACLFLFFSLFLFLVLFLQVFDSVLFAAGGGGGRCGGRGGAAAAAMACAGSWLGAPPHVGPRPGPCAVPVRPPPPCSAGGRRAAAAGAAAGSSSSATHPPCLSCCCICSWAARASGAVAWSLPSRSVLPPSLAACSAASVQAPQLVAAGGARAARHGVERDAQWLAGDPGLGD